MPQPAPTPTPTPPVPPSFGAGQATSGANERAKALLTNLAALTQYRAETEAAIVQRLSDGESSLRRAFEDAASVVETKYLTDKKQAETDIRKKTAALQQRFKAELEPAERTAAEEIQAFQARTNTLELSAKEKLEESLWLADTLVESGETKARLEFEAVRKHLDVREGELNDVSRQADTILGRLGFGPLSLFEGPKAGDPDPEGFFGSTTLTPDAAKDLALSELWRLDRSVRPAMLRLGAVVAVALGCAAGAGALRGLGVVGGPTAAGTLAGPAAVKAVAVAAAVGFAAGLAVMTLLRLLHKRRIPAAVRRMERAMFAARHAVEVALHAAEEKRSAVIAALQERRKQEVAGARHAHALTVEAVRRRRQSEEPALAAGHEARVNEIRLRYDNAAWELREQGQQRLAAVESERTAGMARAQQTLDDGARALDAREESARRDLRGTWSEGITRVFAGIAELNAHARDAAPSWGDPCWNEAGPNGAAPRGDVPRVVPIGRVEGDLRAMPGGLSGDPRFALAPDQSAEIDLPLCLDLFDRGSLLIETGTEGRTQGLAVLNNVMLRLLTGFPPAKVRFTLVDPVGLGQSFAGFMHLADYDEALVSDKIWTDARHIEQKLTDLTEHMETVIQKYLRNQYASIQEYNRHAGEIAEPYRFLVIADLPTNFTEASARRLASIVTSGARCGVYTLVLADIRQRPPAWVPMADLERGSVTLQWKKDRFTVLDETLAPWPLVLEQPPDEGFSSRLIHDIGTRAKDAGKVQVPFAVVAPPEGKVWTSDAAEEVRVPLGRAGATKLQSLSLGRGTAQHALIAGRTGSGKSTLLHVIITNLAMWYSPAEIEMYLVDFKKGVEFKTYATHQLPHARVIAVESEREFGLSVLRRLDQELTRRGQLYRDAGVQDLAGYRRAAGSTPLRGVISEGPTSSTATDRSTDTNKDTPRRGVPPRGVPPMPRILLLVDEFQEFFVEDDKIAAESSLLLDRLVRQGRAFGMHVVLGSQTLGGAYSLARSTLGQMGVRIALQCSEADSYLIMSEDNTAPRLLSRPGEAIYNDQSGLIEGNSPFQIVWLPDEVRDARLDDVDAALAASGLTRPPPPIVFEGNVPADIGKARDLASVVEHGPSGRSANAPTVWLGDAISIKEPTAFAFARQAGGNMLIVGQQDEPATALSVAACISLAAHSPPGQSQPGQSHLGNNASIACLHVLDATPADAPHAGLLPGIAAGLPGRARAWTPRQTPELLTMLSEELARRELAVQSDPGTPSVGSGAQFPTIVLMIHGLHRVRDLRRPADDYGFSSGDAPATPTQQLARLLKEGPPLGVHVMLWCDTLANLERCLDRNGVREFEARVLFQMSQADSTHLIDGPQASTLGRNRALYFREDLGVIEKFRPYSMPTPDWLADRVARIAAR